MTRTVVGLFENFETAQAVIQDLVDEGFKRENISLMAGDKDGKYARELDQLGAEREEGMLPGQAPGLEPL